MAADDRSEQDFDEMDNIKEFSDQLDMIPPPLAQHLSIVKPSDEIRCRCTLITSGFEIAAGSFRSLPAMFNFSVKTSRSISSYSPHVYGK